MGCLGQHNAGVEGSSPSLSTNKISVLEIGHQMRTAARPANDVGMDEVLGIAERGARAAHCGSVGSSSTFSRAEVLCFSWTVDTTLDF